MWNKHIHQITVTAIRTLPFVRRNLCSCPNILKNLPTQLLFVHFLNIHHPYGTTHQDTRKTIEKGCISEMIGKLNLEPLNIRRTYRRLTIFHKAIIGPLALPIGHLQPVLRRTRHLNSKAYNTIHTSKDCYKHYFFSRKIKDWNSLPDKLATIKEPHKFKLALTHFD